VDADHRVDGDQQVVVHAAGVGAVACGLLGAAVAVLGAQATKARYRGGQAFVRGDQIGPLGVAADSGRLGARIDPAGGLTEAVTSVCHREVV